MNAYPTPLVPGNNLSDLTNPAAALSSLGGLALAGGTMSGALDLAGNAIRLIEQTQNVTPSTIAGDDVGNIVVSPGTDYGVSANLVVIGGIAVLAAIDLGYNQLQFSGSGAYLADDGSAGIQGPGGFNLSAAGLILPGRYSIAGGLPAASYAGQYCDCMDLCNPGEGGGLGTGGLIRWNGSFWARVFDGQPASN